MGASDLLKDTFYDLQVEIRERKATEEDFPALTGTGIPERYRLIASTGEVWHADQVVYEGDAIRGVFEVNAFQMVPGRMVAMFTDVTERRSAERSLRESEEMNRVLVEAFPDMVLRLDGKGTFLSFKAARDQEPFRPPGSFLGLTVEEAMPREIAERSMLHLRRALETGKVQIFEYRLTRDDGDRDFEIRVIASGEDEVIALAREITSRKRAESALEKARDDLERQNRELLKLDRMKEALISDVSHELKTPVAKQAMQVEILRKALREFNLAEKVEDIFKVMESGISRQQNVIRNILVMSRLESGSRKDKMEEFPLDGLVKEVLGDYRSMAFERFYQASSSAEGIGPGLSISTNIVERFGGSLQLESGGRGRGATATVSLPLASR